MIACDFPNCAIEWYHTRCLKSSLFLVENGIVPLVKSYLNAKQMPNNELAILISHNFCITNCFMNLRSDVFVIEGI